MKYLNSLNSYTLTEIKGRSMSAGLHLNHKVSWSDLKDLLTQYADPGIEMPVGPCGLIHLTSKKVQIQVEHRNYLVDKICRLPDCPVSGSQIFRKNLKQKQLCPKYWIFPTYNSKLRSKQVKHFINSFTLAIHEFADTERKKVTRIVNTNPDRLDFVKKIYDVLKKNHPDLKIPLRFEQDISCFRNNYLCPLLPILIEAGETEILLEFNGDEIKSVFHCQHGGQAVGNNLSFLYHHVMTAYMFTNLIVAFGLQEKPTDWGPMAPNNNYFRRELMYDCDGQTFLDSCRKFLMDDVYMKDFNAMKELCKTCFKFIYTVEMLAKEVGISWLDNNSLWFGYEEEGVNKELG